MTKNEPNTDRAIELLSGQVELSPAQIKLLLDQIGPRDEYIGDLEARMEVLQREMENFKRMAISLGPSPDDIPELNGFSIYGESDQLNGEIGGDLLVFHDFKKRHDLDLRIKQAIEAGKPDVAEKLYLNKKRVGILKVDVSGHQITDAFLAGIAKKTFKLGVINDLYEYGEVTTRLFEDLNTVLHNSSSSSKYLTFIYGEISENGMFRYINGGHPPPVVFSNKYDRLVDIGQDRLVTSTPLGIMPSGEHIDRDFHFSHLGYKAKYTTNELELMGSGDILFLYSDGLSEHRNGNEDYFPTRFEQDVRQVKDQSARDIVKYVKQLFYSFGPPSDDVTLVAIKKN